MLSGSGRIRIVSSSMIKSTEFCHSLASSSRLSGTRPRRLPLPAEPVEIGHPLRGVNARQGHDRVAEGKDRGHAGLQFPVAIFGQRMFAKDVEAA